MQDAGGIAQRDAACLFFLHKGTEAMDIKALQDKYAALLDKQEKMLEAIGEDDPTDEQEAEFKAIDSDLEKVARAIDRHNAHADRVKARPGKSTDDLDLDEPERADVRHVKDRVMDDPQRGFKSLGHFGQSVARAMTPGAGGPDEQMQIYAAATGMSQGVGSEGGFTVPPSFANSIWDRINSGVDNLLNRTDNYTVEGESLTFNANAETNRATGSRYGGVRGYWIAEADQITSSKPKFRQVKLEPQQLAVLVYSTEKLLRNSGVALEQYLTRAASEEINWLIGESIINGTGAGQPRGIVGHTSTVSVAKESGQAAATIVKKNIDKMWARLHPRARANSVWFINVDVEPALEDLSMDVGTGGVPVYLPPGGITDTPNARLKGRPVLPIEYCATLGTVGDIILADLSGYAVGLQGGLESAMSMHIRFEYAEMAFRWMFAIDGRPWLESALTPAKGSNTLSTFVTLATRA